MYKALGSPLQKVARILTERWGVEVVFERGKCCTNGNKIWLPAPESENKTWITAVEGQLDHEISHVLFSDFEVVKETTEGTFLFILFQFLEDYRTITKLTKIWPGVAKNIRFLDKWKYGILNESKWVGKTLATKFAALCYVYLSLKEFWVEDFGSTDAIQNSDHILGFAFERCSWILDEYDREIDKSGIYDPEGSRTAIRYAEKIIDFLGIVEDYGKRSVPDPLGEKQSLEDDDDDESDTSGDLDDSSEDQEELYVDQGIDRSQLSKLHEDSYADTPNDFSQLLADERHLPLNCYAERYSVFTTAGDRISHTPPYSPRAVELSSWMREAQALVGPVKRQITNFLRASKKNKTSRNQLRGITDVKVLHKIPVERAKGRVTRPRVFKKIIEAPAYNTIVSIVVDCSFSMRGHKLRVASQAVFILGEVLSSLRIPFEIIGHTTDDQSVGRGRRAEHLDLDCTRWGNLVVTTYKGFAESWRHSRKSLLALAVQRGVNSYNAEVLEIAARRMVAQGRYNKYVIFDLFDGLPCPNITALFTQHNLHLHEVVGQLKGYGFELVAFNLDPGTGTDFGLTKQYTRWIDVKSVRDLPRVLSTQMKKVLE